MNQRYTKNKLREFRKAKGWSQEHLTDISGVSLRTIQRIEAEKTVPQGDTKMALANAFKVEVHELFPIKSNLEVELPGQSDRGFHRLKKLLSNLELIDDSDGIQHPKDKNFSLSSFWTDEGLLIEGGNITIEPVYTMPLLEVFVETLPIYVESDLVEFGEDDAYERAYITATIVAFRKVFNEIPTELEMERGVSILSRKINLFYCFARDLYERSRVLDIDVQEYLFPEENQTEEELGREDLVQLYRTFLHIYISRICDVNLDEVESFENFMKEQSLPAWEILVETIYGVDERKILKAFGALKKQEPDKSDEELVLLLLSFFVQTTSLEAFPLKRENFEVSSLKEQNFKVIGRAKCK